MQENLQQVKNSLERTRSKFKDSEACKSAFEKLLDSTLNLKKSKQKQMLPLKVSQLETLFKENWIAIDGSKRGPSNHKAFLTKEGKKIIQDRQKDFQLIFLMKEPDSYLFTAESNHFYLSKRYPRPTS